MKCTFYRTEGINTKEWDRIIRSLRTDLAMMEDGQASKEEIRQYLKEYGSVIENVSCGGESGPDARICDYAWVMNTQMQCVEFGVPFHFHQTGAKLRHHGKIYEIPRDQQHTQARKAGLDYGGGLEIPECLQHE